jgi:hypothetical protein
MNKRAAGAGAAGMTGSRAPLRRRRGLSRCPGVAGAMAAVAACAALAGGVPVTAAAASTPASGPSWSWPHELPASADIRDSGIFTGLSCSSGSDCTAVGTYNGSAGRYRDFAITERRGVWGRAVTFTAPIASKKVFFGGLPLLACASAGNCAASDTYHTFSQSGAFVISETNGTWGPAREVRAGPAAIACPAPGGCTAVLSDGDLLNEVHGTWRTAFPLPGLAALAGTNPLGSEVIACPSPGNCTAGGTVYYNGADYQAFVVTETHGLWGDAQLIRSRPGIAHEMGDLTCTSAGNCVAGGWSYPPDGYSFSAFAVTQTHGTWSTAKTLPGTAALNSGIGELSCPAPGDCTALGSFAVGDEARLFVSTEKNGTWHNPQTIAGYGPGPGTAVGSLTCPAAGNCVLTGAITDEPQAASAAQLNGHWGRASLLPGILATDKGQASAIEALSCPARSRCTAVGSLVGQRPLPRQHLSFPAAPGQP